MLLNKPQVTWALIPIFMGLVACGGGPPSSSAGLPSTSGSNPPVTAEPTPDIAATISAAVEATITAPAGASKPDVSATTPSPPTTNVTPVQPVASTFTSTIFDPATVMLSSIDISVSVALRTSDLELGVDGVQVNIQHPGELDVSSPTCVGIFEGAVVLPTVKVVGGTLIGCFFPSGNVKGSNGEIIAFQLTRVGNFAQDQVLILGLEGTTGTQFSDAGRSIIPGLTNQLVAKP